VTKLRCADPMCSMLRDPRREDQTTCTAVAPDFVFTVRTYGTGPLHGPARQAPGLTGKPAPAHGRDQDRNTATRRNSPSARGPRRAAVSAQIPRPKTRHPQVSAARLRSAHESEPTQASSPPAADQIPLTRNEIAALFSTLIIEPARETRHRLRWSTWRRRHQHRAKTCHYQRQARQP
jgi:hypothetical protein